MILVSILTHKCITIKLLHITLFLEVQNIILFSWVFEQYSGCPFGAIADGGDDWGTTQCTSWKETTQIEQQVQETRLASSWLTYKQKYIILLKNQQVEIVILKINE